MQELIFGLIGGTALLMYGVDKMGEGLENASGDMMKKILTVLTGRVWSAFLVGTLLTALVQSSTAITLLTVGFVNAGLMKLPQAVGIIYGANIGTTITAQLMAFSFHFKLTDYALPVIGIGFAISAFSKRKTIKDLGSAMMGFGMMFLGLKILNSGVPFINSNPTMRYFFLNYASIPIVGIILGALATALVHSSAATVGLVIVLGQAGLLNLTAAVAIMLGDNIGTCFTAQLASLTGNIGARRTAWAHTIYNLIGVIIVAVILPWFVEFVAKTTVYLQPTSDIGAQIANSHTLFNVLSAAVFLPLNNHYVRFLELVIREKKQEQPGTQLDRLLVGTPVAAFRATLAEIIRGAGLSRGMINQVMEAFFTADNGAVPAIEADEEKVNALQRDITGYIVEVSRQPLSETESVMVPAMINCINNIERIADHSMEMLELVQHKNERGLPFSKEAVGELKALEDLVLRMLDSLILALRENNPELAKENAKLEDMVDEMCQSLERSHLRRLEDGVCLVESGVIFLDILTHFERIADHIYKVSLMATDELKGVARAS